MVGRSVSGRSAGSGRRGDESRTVEFHHRRSQSHGSFLEKVKSSCGSDPDERGVRWGVHDCGPTGRSQGRFSGLDPRDTERV